MEIEFIKPKVQAGRRYHGEITRYAPNRTQTALYVLGKIGNCTLISCGWMKSTTI